MAFTTAWVLGHYKNEITSSRKDGSASENAGCYELSEDCRLWEKV